MTADEIRDAIMQKETADIRNEVAQLCEIVSKLVAQLEAMIKRVRNELPERDESKHVG